MKLIVKDMDISTGDVPVVILSEVDAALLDVHYGDRVLVQKGRKYVAAVVNIGVSSRVVSKGRIGLFEEVLEGLSASGGDVVHVSVKARPASINFIRKKMDGEELSSGELLEITKDIVEKRLTDIELASFVAANYTRGMSMKEVVALTHAMKDTGSVLNVRSSVVADIHSIGGVPGNRTTLIAVPILMAAGLLVPKTSSRAITSPSGTADTMEVLCDVSLSMQKLKKVLNSVGGFIVWGGAVNLAPADDRIIRVEHPLRIDAEGQMLASIMAKKASVGSTHVLMDIPYGRGAKVESLGEAHHLEHLFLELGKKLKMNVSCMLTDGSQPVGNGVGPALEARDCLWVLGNDSRGSVELRRKSVEMAGAMLEFTCKCKPGKGLGLAESLLESGEALKKMRLMIRAQGLRVDDPDKIKLGRFVQVVRAQKSGKVQGVDNVSIAKIARLAGAPRDIGAGVELHKHCRDVVQKGESLLTIFSDHRQSLTVAVEFAKEHLPFRVR